MFILYTKNEKEKLTINKDTEIVDLNSSCSSLKDLIILLKEMQSFYDN